MKAITVNASKTYDVLVGRNILDNAGEFIRKTSGGTAAAIITDSNVGELYGERLAATLTQNGYRTVQYTFPQGEESKNAETLVSILNFLAQSELNRSDIVIALGGGVTGDLAGFAAASYMRGIHFTQIPTTLLAAVDSSVGGKTGINLNAGKNLAGAFYQPDIVICDVSLLSTLDEDVFRNGCAEVIKYGIIADEDLFESLKKPINGLPIDTRLEDVISRCVEIKRDIVVQDEFEGGIRKLLNFGHTAGHAIELLSGYAISHGEAVATGMAIEMRCACRSGFCDKSDYLELVSLLEMYNLPCVTEFTAERLIDAAFHDKKRSSSGISLIIPEKIGKCVIRDFGIDEFSKFIKAGTDTL